MLDVEEVDMTTETVQAKKSPKPEGNPTIDAKETSAAEASEAGSKRAHEAAPKATETDPVSRVGRAEAIVRRNVLWSLGAGIVPFPVFDAVALMGVQLKMLAELSNLYKVEFTEEIAKKLIGSLLSSLGGVTLGTFVGGSLAKFVPFVGVVLGVISVPIIGGAFTHATGRVFTMHFEAGGTFLNFDPHKMRTYFKKEFETAKQTVAEIRKKEEQATANKVA